MPFFDSVTGGEITRQPAKMWGWLLALGILQVMLGVVALSAAVVTTMATVVLFGIVVLVGGIVEIVGAFSARPWRGFSLHLLLGILGAVVGLLVILNPAIGAAALTLLVAAWLLVTGIGQIVHGASERFPQWGWSVASGVVSAILGAILFAQFPVSSLWFFGIYVGIALVVQGVTWITLAMVVHNAQRAEPVPQPST